MASGAATAGVGLFLAILVLGVLALGVISIIGQVFLTKFAFQSTTSGTTHSISLAQWELSFAKTTVILQWIMIGLTFVGGITQAVILSGDK